MVGGCGAAARNVRPVAVGGGADLAPGLEFGDRRTASAGQAPGQRDLPVAWRRRQVRDGSRHRRRRDAHLVRHGPVAPIKECYPYLEGIGRAVGQPRHVRLMFGAADLPGAYRRPSAIVTAGACLFLQLVHCKNLAAKVGTGPGQRDLPVAWRRRQVRDGSRHRRRRDAHLVRHGPVAPIKECYPYLEGIGRAVGQPRHVRLMFGAADLPGAYRRPSAIVTAGACLFLQLVHCKNLAAKVGTGPGQRDLPVAWRPRQVRDGSRWGLGRRGGGGDGGSEQQRGQYEGGRATLKACQAVKGGDRRRGGGGGVASGAGERAAQRMDPEKMPSARCLSTAPSLSQTLPAAAALPHTSTKWHGRGPGRKSRIASTSCS